MEAYEAGPYDRTFESPLKGGPYGRTLEYHLKRDPFFFEPKSAPEYTPKPCHPHPSAEEPQLRL